MDNQRALPPDERYDFDVIVPVSPANRYECACPPVFEADALRVECEDLKTENVRLKRTNNVQAWVFTLVAFVVVLLNWYAG